ncbi:hypothetical protein GUA46_10510 [Muricauda sp. HICW]|uniref:Uncharacterized protein n=1 Tax=Flagellimonas chongwuensis TaxID=2697365 RepID=A0A850NFD1_9FLAO|nr:hypothetical protein [Allomuricauda chongwuensis]NVN18774.1 hypothetical protein [Allomuricauda chongwuensis]
MVVKFIESTYDSVKDKLKNPFYGTLFIVWVIRNREFIFNVFFNENVNSDKRLEIIRSHFLSWDSLLSFIGTIFISLGLMVLIYFSLNLSRLIVELSERVLKPRIQKIFSETSIVSREEYQTVINQRDHYIKRFNEENQEKLRLQEELDTKGVTKQNIDGQTSENLDTPNKIDIIFFQDWDDNLQFSFKKLIAEVNNHHSAGEVEEKVGDEYVEEFRGRDLIEIYYDGGVPYYKFTPLGIAVKDFFNKNNIRAL